MSRVTPEDIDALLPQTQCGLCGYGGCMPYAEAILFDNAEINLCPPGGTKTLIDLANLLQKDASPHLEEMRLKAKPKALAIIREEECIGCTKCITACPVDAILGNAKRMHTVIADECTGCELCVPVCPVDCIDIINLATSQSKEDKSAHFRHRYQAREQRLRREKAQKKLSSTALNTRKSYVDAAISRVKEKRK